MKRKLFLFFTIIFTFTMIFVSCKKADSIDNNSLLIGDVTDEEDENDNLEVNYTYVNKDYDYTKDFTIQAENLFDLDFTPYPQYIVLDDASQTNDKTNDKTSDKSNTQAKQTPTTTQDETDGVIPLGTVMAVKPGLRQTGEYITKYNTTHSFEADFQNGSDGTNGQASQTNTDPFTIIAWGPNTRLSSSNKHPEFYIMFSEPVVPLAKLGTNLKTTDIFTITPPLKGEYRWNGTSLLTFFPKEEINPQTIYTIKVNSNAKSLTGKLLEGETQFETTADKLKVVYSTIGETYKRENSTYFYKSDIPPEAAKEYKVTFNYNVESTKIKDRVKITADSNTTEYKNEYKKHNNELTFTTYQEDSDCITFFINEELLPESTITLYVDDEKLDSFSTVYELSYKSLDAIRLGEGKFAIKATFNTNIDESTVLGAITTNIKNYTLQAKDITVDKNTITFNNLPITYSDEVKITIDKKLKDVYGRTLAYEQHRSVRVPGASSYVSMNNRRMGILESQFPKKVYFEFQNLLDYSKYRIGQTRNPYDTTTRFTEPKANSITIDANGAYTADAIVDENTAIAKREADETMLETDLKSRLVKLNKGIPNTPNYEVVEFDEFLTNGKGTIRLDIAGKIKNSWSNSIYDSFVTRTIQITDLGATARIGINKAVVLVTSLETGKPIENADVYVFAPELHDYTNVENPQNHLGKATTDKDGLAIVKYDIADLQKLLLENHKPYSSYADLAIAVKTQDDSVTFYPDTHSPYKAGIYNTSNLAFQLQKQNLTFMFTDRGLYQPGETVSFKGISRSLYLGQLTPFVGDYEIVVSEDNWYNPKTVTKMTGKTSTNGSFDGKFELPKDLTPGNYSIKITVNEPEKNSYSSGITSQTIRFKVAFFERLKFEASVAINDQVYTQGDTIQATVEAKYLAGGALNEAQYNSYWYNEPAYFTTDNKEFNKYTFGPDSSSISRSYLKNDKGNLSSNGKAVFSCDSSNSTVKGQPYKYLVTTDITDASNQMISASSSIIVHPASYYIGLKGASGFGTLNKKGESVTFDFKLANNDGTATKELAEITNANELLTVELLLNDWTIIQQQGVNGKIYSRYDKVQTSEYKESIPLALSGKLKITPKEVGYYTLRLSSKDNKDRDVITEKTFFVTGQTKSWVVDESSTSLKLTPNKSKYVPGENATILLESPLPEGYYLITVEREGIFTEELKYFESSVNTIDIPIARNYVPTVYVSISSFMNRTGEPTTSLESIDLNKPKSLYGVCQLFIDKTVKSFDIEVQNAKTTYKPGEEATITLKASKNGLPLKNTELTLMAVDRSVLDLINYHVPDPIEFFYSNYNFPLAVNGGDVRAYLLDPVTFETKNLNGGDADSDDKDENERKDFTPTAVFEPTLITDENGTVTCKFKLPDSLTTYRITVFGVNGELLAITEDSFMVQNPINVQQVMPRRLRERDTSECGVIVTNLDSKPQDVTIKVAVASPTATNSQNATDTNIVAKIGKAFIDGPTEHTITVYPQTTVPVYFDIAAESEGNVNVEFKVASSILNEKLTCPLIVEKPRMYETVATSGIIGEQEQSIEEALIIPSSTVNERWDLDLTLGVFNDFMAMPTLKYFAEYPYNCFEQRSSRLIAFLLYEDLLLAEAPEFLEEYDNLHDYVVANFKLFAKNKKSSGLFPYWEQNSQGNYLATARIAHAASLAFENGYKESELNMTKADLVKTLLSIFNNKVFAISQTQRNYALYVASLLNKNAIQDSELKDAFKKSETLSDYAITGLLALQMNKNDTAKQCYAKIEPFLQPSSRSVDIVKNDEIFYTDSSTFNSDITTLSFVANFFAKYDQNNPYLERLLFALSEKQRNGYWNNTFTSSTALLAMKNLMKSESKTNTSNSISTNATLGSTTLISQNLDTKAEKPTTKQFSSSQSMFKGIPSNIAIPFVITKNADAKLFYTMQMKYSLPEEILSAKEMGLTVSTRIIDTTTGQEITYNDETSSVMQLENGKIYKMEVTVSSTKDREYVALNMSIPSGAEILDTSFVTTKKDYAPTDNYNDDYDDYDDYWYYYDFGHYVTNQAIYDNEIRYFYDTFAKGSTTASFNFRASRTGVFPTPPAYAECMYQSEVFGRSSGTLFTIK